MGRISRVVPKQWVRYNAVGSVIGDTRILVFKTPIGPELSTKIPKNQRFDVLDLLRICAERGLTLGLVVDLTDTDRYYDKDDVEGMCIPYEKISCPGRGFVDRDDLVDTFNSVIENFIDSNAENDFIIGVHCTNGINRSGYLVCHYLIDRLGWSSHDAIDAFERARGHPIERGSYIQALHKAAKERRTKKRHKHSEEILSSEDEVQRQLRKRKHKKKRKADAGSGDENDNPDQLSMEAVWNQMALAYEQHKSASEALVNYSVASASPLDHQQQSHASSHVSAEESPYIGSNDGGDAEEVVENLNGDQEYPIVEEVSRSKKRKERRQRLQKQFEIMKTGNFWKINEMQKEKFSAK